MNLCKKMPILALLVLWIAVVSTGMELYLYARTPADPQGSQVVVCISAGEDFAATSHRLEVAGLIKHAVRLRYIALFRGDDVRVRAGEYLLSPSQSPLEILDTLVRGREVLHRLTIPEGCSLHRVAAIVEESGFVSADAFMTAARLPETLREMGVASESLEGYLFPDTYYFPRGVTARQIIGTMVRRFWSVFTPRWVEQTQVLGMTVHEAVTLASIIEKETADDGERPIVASVFHNRIKRGMRLESDPTVIYGIEDFDGNITRRHLAAPSAYNTYKIQGLPPGPIANPGKKSLEAALFPAPTPYLFFVARKDKTHHFSTNLADHERAVLRYQKGRK